MTQNSLENRYMQFTLNGQPFALPLISVKEVIQKPEITTVPNMPSHFEGMINLRGKIIGVISARRKLGLKSGHEKTLATPEVVIVVERKGVSVGMIVDEVTKVIHADASMIKEAPIKADDPIRKHVLNVIQDKDDMVISIDVDQLLEFEKYNQNLAA